MNKYLLILSLCIANFFANSAYSSIAPFYPGEAVKKGVSNSVLGLVFSVYSFSMFIMAPFIGTLMNKMGRKTALQVGCLFEVCIINNMVVMIRQFTWICIGTSYYFVWSH
jgi:predicted MFS family arabinose efflux permease